MSSKLLLVCGLGAVTILGCGPATPPPQAPSVETPAKPVVFAEFATKHGFRVWWPGEPVATATESDPAANARWLLNAEFTTQTTPAAVVFELFAVERVEPTRDTNEHKRTLETVIEDLKFLAPGIPTIERTNFAFGKGNHLAVDATLTWSRDRCRVLVVITQRHTFRLSCLTRDRDLLTRDPVERFIKSFELIE